MTPFEINDARDLRGPNDAALLPGLSKTVSLAPDPLELVAETGDPAMVKKEVVGLFVADGDDPFALVENVNANGLGVVGVSNARHAAQNTETTAFR